MSEERTPLDEVIDAFKPIIEEGDYAWMAYWLGYLQALIDAGQVVYLGSGSLRSPGP